MTRHYATVLALLSSIALRAVPAQQSPPLAQDLDRLRGTFTMIRGQADGEPMPPAMAKEMKRIAQGNSTTVTMGGQPYFKANFSINPAASPKTIDYEMTEGFTAGKRQLGIYRLRGDTVTFCFGSPGQSRPSEFESKPGGGVTCSDWKRESP